jgi:hypothetical protein
MRQQHIALRSVEQLEWAAAIAPARISRDDEDMLENLSVRRSMAGDIADSISEGLRLLQFGTSKLTLKEVPETKNRLNVNPERRPKNAPARGRGAICRDRANNVIRLLSMCRGYCIYVYIALGDPKSEIHGSLTGLTRRDLFEAGFIFVAQDWNGSQPKSSDTRVQAFHIHPPVAQSRSRRVTRPNAIDPRSVSPVRTSKRGNHATSFREG